jgi:hypothetical protein
MSAEIEGETLTSFQVSPDGTQFRLNLRDAEGGPASVTLPTDCLNQLVMTMPRIAAEALCARFHDNSLRLVYPIGDWTIESALGDPKLILTLRTPDGFEIAFAIDSEDIARMGVVAAEREVASRYHQTAAN